MINIPHNLPIPDAAQQTHSQELAQFISNDIRVSGGKITFARFMELALYAPELGYYTAGLHKLGAGGDFITAPEISSLFSYCLAEQCRQVLLQLTQGAILEFGAGTGRMAADILLVLEEKKCLPVRYFILEISADLRDRQQRLLKEKIPHLFERVIWLDKLPENFEGVVLANEALDAMPVHRFSYSQKRLKEFYVEILDGNFQMVLAEPSEELEKYGLEKQLALLEIGGNYESEINLLLLPWLKSVSACLSKGLILLIDYGFPRHEFYHPDRSMGTLMCHYRHHAHDNPLILVGLQDITAHVDFTALAEAAIESDLKVAGFTNQATFLLNSGLLEQSQLESPQTTQQQIKLSRQIQLLTSPAEMGELFKVMALTRGLEEISLRGVCWGDQRGRL